MDKKKNSNCSELLLYLHKKSCTAYSSSSHVSRLIFRLSQLRNFHHIMYPPSLSFPGLDTLTNVVRGQPHGDVVQWSPSRKRHFGVYLLHKALRAYLIDPPQQIYQTDL